jgi:fumarate hydratase class II
VRLQQLTEKPLHFCKGFSSLISVWSGRRESNSRPFAWEFYSSVIKVCHSKGPDMVMQGLAIGTALAPLIGYDDAADIAKAAAKSGETIKEVALRMAPYSSEELDVILEPLAMTEPKA